MYVHSGNFNLKIKLIIYMKFISKTGLMDFNLHVGQ